MIGKRIALVLFAASLTLAVAGYAGPRSGMLILIGLGFGLALEGLRFGFAGPWRAMIVEGDARGLIAQLLAIGLTACVALPLLSAAPDELSGAHGPVGFAMVGGAFVFGTAMQLVFGCGSGTLVNAGSGNLVGAVALPGFVAGVSSERFTWPGGPISEGCPSSRFRAFSAPAAGWSRHLRASR